MIKQKNRCWSRFAWMSFFLILVVSFYCVWELNRTQVHRGQKKIFLMDAHASTKTILSELNQQQLVRLPILLQWFSNISMKKPIYSGEYLIIGPATTLTIWRQLLSGKGLYQRSFMIVPGMTTKQIFLSLSQNPFLTEKEFLNQPEFIAKTLGLPSSDLEGWFLPETYFYTRGSSVLQILGRAFDLMKKNLDEAWRQRAPNLPFQTPYQALIAASLVEKEAFFPEDKPKIASVLVNRLRLGMRLQFDPTVIYALGSSYQGSLSRADLKMHSPFNTYWITGLPPTPIANPSKKTLYAVLQAPQTSFLYFVLSGRDKHHIFSNTLAQHEKAVNQARLLQVSGKSSQWSCPVQYLGKHWQSMLSISALSEMDRLNTLLGPSYFCWHGDDLNESRKIN